MKVSYGDIQVAIFKVMQKYFLTNREIFYVTSSIKVATNFVFRSSSIRLKPDPDV